MPIIANSPALSSDSAGFVFICLIYAKSRSCPVRISISCGPFTEKNTVEIEKQQSHPRRAQQSHPRRQSAAGLPSYAPHESKARLQHESTRRDPWRSHVHRTRFDKRRSSSSYRLPMQRGRGARPLAFSWRSKGDILSRERISPLPDSSAKRCTSPPRSARNPPRFPV